MPRCTTIKLAGGALPVGCHIGVVTEFTHIGVYGFQSEADIHGLCSSGDASDARGVDCDALSDHNSPLFLQLKEQCIGKSSCIINDLHSYVEIGSQTFDPGCSLEENSTLYVQYMC